MASPASSAFSASGPGASWGTLLASESASSSSGIASAKNLGRDEPLWVEDVLTWLWESPMGPTWMMSDFAHAARNAASKIWVGERKFEHAMCSVHVFGRWMEKNRGLFKDYDANYSDMNIDFESLKNCPMFLLVNSGILFTAMIAKWKGYGEIEIAEAFDKQWYGMNFCRVTINYSPRNWVPAGGNPSDNNGTEATNRAHKYFINHVHVTGENYISDIATWAKHKSIQDTSFGWALNRHVHSKRFYLAVGAMLLEGPTDINPFMACGSDAIPGARTRLGIRLRDRGRWPVKGPVQ
mmetsp:Transcript_54791/g.124749  ORF Transcript_54791/g.124749 Transcript_54791/m.124749 type:complete len:295 (+) Transcript_54791:45-929(+)